MRTLAGATLLLLVSLISDASAQATPEKGVYLTIRPAQVGSLSFLFDDCGEHERGERFRTNFLDVANLCPRRAVGQRSFKERLRTEIEKARPYHVGMSSRPSSEGICGEKRREYWGVLLDMEQDFQKWRSHAMADERIAHEVCE